MTTLEEYEDGLREHLEKELTSLPGVRLWSRAAAPHADPAAHLRRPRRRRRLPLPRRARRQRPGRLVLRARGQPLAGLGDTGGLRVGLAPYSDRDDVDRLLAGLREFLAG